MKAINNLMQFCEALEGRGVYNSASKAVYGISNGNIVDKSESPISEGVNAGMRKPVYINFSTVFALIEQDKLFYFEEKPKIKKIEVADYVPNPPNGKSIRQVETIFVEDAKDNTYWKKVIGSERTLEVIDE